MRRRALSSWKPWRMKTFDCDENPKDHVPVLDSESTCLAEAAWQGLPWLVDGIPAFGAQLLNALRSSIRCVPASRLQAVMLGARWSSPVDRIRSRLLSFVGSSFILLNCPCKSYVASPFGLPRDFYLTAQSGIMAQVRHDKSDTAGTGRADREMCVRARTQGCRERRKGAGIRKL